MSVTDFARALVEPHFLSIIDLRSGLSPDFWADEHPILVFQRDFRLAVFECEWYCVIGVATAATEIDLFGVASDSVIAGRSLAGILLGGRPVPVWASISFISGMARTCICTP